MTRNSSLRFGAIAAAFALAACTPAASPPAADVAPAPTAAPALEAKPYEVKLALSPKALALLKTTGEEVVVSAMYYAEPQPGFEPKEPGDVGVDFGEEEKTVPPGDQTIQFQGQYDPAKLAREGKGNLRVLINVYSAREAGTDNVLSCPAYDDELRVAAGAGIIIPCKLIEE